MTAIKLEPWMLRADWRDMQCSCVLVDLASWPSDCALSPLPPFPVVASGPPDHPLALQCDVVEDSAVPMERLLAGIAAAPRATATLIGLLRMIGKLPAEAALEAESLAMATLQVSAEHRNWRDGRTASASPIACPGKAEISRTGSCLDIVLHRPRHHNAIDRAMRDELFEAFTLAAYDDSIEKVTLRGDGRTFSVGADLDEFGTIVDASEAHGIRRLTLPARALLGCRHKLEARIGGACVGSGLELAAFAMRIEAERSAWFQLPEVGMGILPGAGGCVSIPARIGRQRAALLMLSGKKINAETALRWGLVDALVDELR